MVRRAALVASLTALLAFNAYTQTKSVNQNGSLQETMTASPGLAALYVRALESSDPGIKEVLALMFEDGVRLSPNPGEALNWYRAAANEGSAGAQTRLAHAYRDGSLGLSKDLREAVTWYRKAADQAAPTAQYELGRAYFFGSGVPQDFIQAHMWANLAVTRLASSESLGGQMGISAQLRQTISDSVRAATELRNQVSLRMTSQQLAEAQRLAREWKPEKGN